jgi:hypothetical protein
VCESLAERALAMVSFPTLGKPLRKRMLGGGESGEDSSGYCSEAWLRSFEGILRCS